MYENFRDNSRAYPVLLQRAPIKDAPISCAIVEALCGRVSVSVEELQEILQDDHQITMTTKNIRKSIETTNARLDLIYNLDPANDVVIARIYSMTLEANGGFFERVFLVHNL